MKKLTLLVIPFLVTGCYLGKFKDDITWAPEDVAKIKVGVTTKAELFKILGPPREIVKLIDSDAFIYRHVIEKNTGLFLILLNMQRNDRQQDAVAVIVNREGIVTAVGSRWAAEQSGYGLPWSD